jgi:hypothetical protein
MSNNFKSKVSKTIMLNLIFLVLVAKEKILKKDDVLLIASIFKIKMVMLKIVKNSR